jgi:competence protein ComEC
VVACLGVHGLPVLPSKAWFVLALSIGLGAWMLGALRASSFRLARGWAPAWVFAAFAGWAGLCAHHALGERIAAEHEGIDVALVGMVEQMPRRFEQGVQFDLRVVDCLQPAQGCRRGGRYRLTWYDGRKGSSASAAPRLQPGECHALVVRLKRPVAPVNPGLFDGELRALEEGVAALGYVRSADSSSRDRATAACPSIAPGALVERLRARIRDAMLNATNAHPPEVRGVLVALVVGDQSAVPPSWWDRFNRTGIGHLMSISGLHITMLAGLAAWLAGRLWASRLARWPGRPLPERLPVPHARALAGVFTAFAYSALAGWGIPAQRTSWMLAFAAFGVVGGRGRGSVDILSAALLAVLALDPWAPLAAGFWLSFAAVALIIWSGSLQRARQLRLEWLVAAVRTQWTATLALLPLGALFFSSFSVVGPIANAIAIPLVSAVVTPLSLAGGLLEYLHAGLGGPLLALAAWSVRALLAVLSWLDAPDWASWVLGRPTSLVAVLAMLGTAIVLAPWRLPGRAVATLAIAPLFALPVDAPAEGELWLTALDVGQGMAVLVETGGRRLLYDTGPAHGQDSEAGSRVILPYLRSRGIGRLDAMVVSHLDTDHSGGALAILRSMPVDWVASSLMPDHAIARAARRHYACRRGERWRWGSTEFEWLHPGEELPARRGSATNARSCVLRIAAAAGTALLPGDLEAPQEAALLAAHAPETLRADVLLAPHHGSATSSTEAFLRAVAPQWAVFQVGYRNRFRHPHPKVDARYAQASIARLRTDWHGAIQVRLKSGAPPVIIRARLDPSTYWRILSGPDAPASATGSLGGPPAIDVPRGPADLGSRVGTQEQGEFADLLRGHEFL